MKYVVDRIEDSVVILENLNNKEKLELQKEILPKGIKDGSVVVLKDNKYVLDLEEEQRRRQSILERFNRLKKNWYHKISFFFLLLVEVKKSML